MGRQPDNPLLVKARDLLLQGRVKRFNALLQGLRKDGQDLAFSLSRKTLAGLDLRGADLRGALLERVTLSDADLSGANFDGAVLNGCIADGAKLEGASFVGAEIGPFEVDKNNRQDSRFQRANLRKTRFERASLLEGTDLSEADLREANLRGASLCRVTVRKTDLTGADGSHCSIEGVKSDLLPFLEGQENADSPTITGLNVFGARLLNTKNANEYAAAPIPWREGTVSNPPSQDTTRNDEDDQEEEEDTMATTSSTSPMVDRFKRNARAGAIAFGAEETINAIRGAIVLGLQKTDLITDDTKKKAIAFLESSAGTAILTAFVSGGLRMGFLDHLPMIPKSVRDLLQREIADELKKNTFKEGFRTLAKLVIPFMGSLGGALIAIATTVEKMSEGEIEPERLPTSDTRGIGVDAVAPAAAETSPAQRMDKA